MLAGDIAKQYIKRYRSTSSRQIARILTKEHPLIFETAEE